jgi:hypothetical protein
MLRAIKHSMMFQSAAGNWRVVGGPSAVVDSEIGHSVLVEGDRHD